MARPKVHGAVFFGYHPNRLEELSGECRIEVVANPNSLIAADYVMILTSLSAETFPAAQVMALYRLRWQVEIAFKRLKGLLRIAARVSRFLQKYFASA